MTTVSRSQVATARDAGDGLAVGTQEPSCAVHLLIVDYAAMASAFTDVVM